MLIVRNNKNIENLIFQDIKRHDFFYDIINGLCRKMDNVSAYSLSLHKCIQVNYSYSIIKVDHQMKITIDSRSPFVTFEELDIGETFLDPEDFHINIKSSKDSVYDLTDNAEYSADFFKKDKKFQIIDLEFIYFDK